jgi:hypothetical protein
MLGFEPRCIGRARHSPVTTVTYAVPTVDYISHGSIIKKAKFK